MTGVTEHGSVNDPCCGSGGMFRAAAAVMRRRGLDPTTVTWVGVDIDETAVAACAANAIVWDLGPRVLLGVANTLTDLDVVHRAARQREEMIGLVRTVHAIRAIEHLLDMSERTASEPAAGGETR